VANVKVDMALDDHGHRIARMSISVNISTCFEKIETRNLLISRKRNGCYSLYSLYYSSYCHVVRIVMLFVLSLLN